MRPVTGALWLPVNAATDTPLVCCGHGASGDRYQAPIPYLARRFVEECGFAVLALDGPVHGLRQRGPGGRQAFAEEMRDPAFVDRMVADWRLALQLVGADRGVGAGRLGYFGLSMGTLFGIPLLAAERGFAVSAVGLCGSRGAAAAIGARLLRDARVIAHPVLFLMQLEDELFDRQGCLELFDAVGSLDKRLHANPGLHPEVPAEEIDFAFEFIAARLRGAVPRRIVNPLAE
jgi:alpha-beta hydrolase superfamily lysophospholipase